MQIQTQFNMHIGTCKVHKCSIFCTILFGCLQHETWVRDAIVALWSRQLNLPLSLLICLDIWTNFYIVFFAQVKLINLRKNNQCNFHKIWLLYHLKRHAARHISLLVFTDIDVQQGLKYQNRQEYNNKKRDIKRGCSSHLKIVLQISAGFQHVISRNMCMPEQLEGEQ